MQEKLIQFCNLDDITKKLIQIYCQQTLHGHELEAWFNTVTFEDLPPYLTCMAAAASSTVRFANVPETLIPRLRGIVKYVHTLNSGMFSGVCLLGTVCNQANIEVLLLDETALYMCYPDAPQRHLWQVCIGVRTAQYKKVLHLAENNGFTITRHPYAAVAQQGITKQIVIRPLDDHSYLWNGTKELKKGSAVFLCPCTATMLIEACQRTFRAFTKPDPKIPLVHWCMDMKILLNHLSDADWLCGKEIAQSEHALYHIRFLLAVYTVITGTKIDNAELFGTKQDVMQTYRLLQAYATCPKTSRKLRRLYLLYRLRRPDCVVAATMLLMQRIYRRIKN